MSSAAQRLVLLAVAAVCLTLAVAAPAGAFRLGPGETAVAHNPADRLAALPADPEDYDPRPTAPRRPGRDGRARRLAAAQRRGRELGHVPLREVGPARRPRCTPRTAPSTGTSTSASPPTRAAATPDRDAPRPRPHRPAARARPPDGRRGDHLGLQLLGRRDAGLQALLAVPDQAREAARKRVDPTVGHRDHLHIGMSKAGAARRTSFWTAAAAGV